MRRNGTQKGRLLEKLAKHYQSGLAGKKIAGWGLSFKPNTDDMREAPSRVLMEGLWQAGAKVQAFDPVAKAETLRIYGSRDDLIKNIYFLEEGQLPPIKKKKAKSK